MLRRGESMGRTLESSLHGLPGLLVSLLFDYPCPSRPSLLSHLDSWWHKILVLCVFHGDLHDTKAASSNAVQWQWGTRDDLRKRFVISRKPFETCWDRGSMGAWVPICNARVVHFHIQRRWNFLWVLNASTVVRRFPHNFGTIWTMFENSGSVVSFLIKRILSHALRYKRVFGKPLITLQGTVHLFGPSCRLPLFGINDSASTNSRGQFRWNRSKSEGTMVIYIRKKGGRKILSKISSEYPMVTSFGTY